jgi:hypothetical protein
MTSVVARPPRPVTVTVAFWLQIAAVAVLLAVVGLAVTGAVLFDAEITRVAGLVADADPAEVRGERTGNVVGALIAAVPAALLAIWLAATAQPLRAGNNTARILVYVAGGAQVVLLCTQACAGALFLPLTLVFAAGPMEADPTGGEPPLGPDEVPWESSAFLDALYADAGPFTDLSFVGAGLAVPLLLVLTAAVIVLISVPPGGRYFVPRAAVPMICPDPSLHAPGPS